MFDIFRIHNGEKIKVHMADLRAGNMVEFADRPGRQYLVIFKEYGGILSINCEEIKWPEQPQG